MASILILILILIVIAVIYIEIRKLIIQKRLRGFSSPKQYPIIGCAHRFIGNDKIIEGMLNIFKEVKKTPAQAWFGPVLAIGICEPKDIEIILTNDHCLDKPYLYKLLKCSTSLIATKKHIWKQHRRALNMSFSTRVLQSYIPFINDKSRILVKNCESMLNDSTDLYRAIFIGMMDTIVRTTMDTEMYIQSERGLIAYNAVRCILSSIQYRLSQYWLKWDFTYSLSKTYHNEIVPLGIADSAIEEVYMKRINYIKKLQTENVNHLENVKKNNLMNVIDRCLILEQEGILNHENVLDQMRLILLAGMDTTATTVFGALILLAIHSEQQEKVIDELKTVFETADCDVTQEHLAQLNYLERVINETLRLFPAGPFILRENTADVQLHDGTIPKNTTICISIMHLHRNQKVWGQNANDFDPDRFLKENIAKRPPFSFIPFSGGPRNCIGMRYAMISIKIVLAHLLRRYKFTSDLKMNEIRMKIHLILEIVIPRPLKIEERHF